MKFAMSYGKNMSFLVIPKSSTVFGKKKIEKMGLYIFNVELLYSFQ